MHVRHSLTPFTREYWVISEKIQTEEGVEVKTLHITNLETIKNRLTTSYFNKIDDYTN